ncbi:hypothetical protein PLICRDRAFT_127395 [Plicaturopsis crispa FD-325 SS-3]|uniref:P-loop containing nucleoside triphosphate hydrolase protein n=1 Tax=Plicaturopsis crispa FD-325 SS-3 TaxID=944288 RepID=A0A0C9SVX2_PLICR|nr:hypothetical protein PLICRDRAFT_127395 [Plicaturopsis crispa FD-325 SS-3]
MFNRIYSSIAAIRAHLRAGSADDVTNIVIVHSGATCSGKTTLAKLLHRVLPNSVIIHQDDFAPPEEQIPLHPTHNIPDWDTPATAIDHPRLAAFLATLKRTGVVPPHHSHDHLNPVPPLEERDKLGEREREWRGVFEGLKGEGKGEEVVWGLVDGFLLYWDPTVVANLDIRILLRVPRAELERRREERRGYHTAEGSFWVDPPGYFAQIVYPAYLVAHEPLFENGDTENGKLIAVDAHPASQPGQPAPHPEEPTASESGAQPVDGTPGARPVESGTGARPVAGLILVEPLRETMAGAVDRVCRILVDAVQNR